VGVTAEAAATAGGQETTIYRKHGPRYSGGLVRRQEVGRVGEDLTEELSGEAGRATDAVGPAH
jgi:hypothetical protein